MKFRSLILAAGKGTRMKSDLPKVLHPLLGRPVVNYILQTVAELGPERIHLVIGHQAELVQSTVEKEQHLVPLDFVLQREQLGTGHAVLQANELLQDFSGILLVLPGDAPLISAATLRGLLDHHQSGGYSATILTTVVDLPTGYGRIIRNPGGDVIGIVEEKDASDEERLIKEINSSIYCFDTPILMECLGEISADNKQGEYYLTDVIKILRQRNYLVGAYVAGDPTEVMGINTRYELAQAGKILWRRKAYELMSEGVTILDPDTAYIHPETQIGPDTIIYPGVMVAENVVIGSGCQVGPFAYLRPGTRLADGVKVGDFVEIKNSVVGTGSKVPHHSYIGDTVIGSGANIGAGTITCNYDGQQKHRTVINDGAFIGSNTNLVAPVTIGQGAYIAAGSTITKDIPDGALGVARSRQVNKEDWAASRKPKS